MTIWKLSCKILTDWGRGTHICVGNLTIIGSDIGLSPGRRQTITFTNVGILLIGPLGTYFSEMLIEIHSFSFKKIPLKMASAKWRPFCLCLDVLKISFGTLAAVICPVGIQSDPRSFEIWTLFFYWYAPHANCVQVKALISSLLNLGYFRKKCKWFSLSFTMKQKCTFDQIFCHWMQLPVQPKDNSQFSQW